jgi:DNA-binding transcriptional MocR family regulator
MLEDIRIRMSEPTARSLARAIGTAVSDGALPAGTRLPPIRVVARELAVSPTTVSAAWALLSRSGTIRTDGRHGSFVATRAAASPQRYRRALDRSHRFDVDLSTGVPDGRLLPSLSPALRQLHTDTMPETYLDEPVVPDLEACLRSDWPYPAEAFTIVDGAMDALDLISVCFVQFGDRVAVENPCFPPLLDLLESAGAEAVPVDLDDDGPMPAALSAALAQGCRMFVYQPRAQNPTGASLTSRRAEELDQVLIGSDVLVVENDSIGAVASSELLSLGAHRARRTLHIRSFSKSHGPDLRLAAIAGPPDLIDRLVDRRHLGQGWTSRVLQRLLLELLTRPQSVAEVARARETYARRRAHLVDELKRREVWVGGTDGLNIWIPVVDESATLISLASRGLGVAPGSPFAVGDDIQAHVRVTSGLLANGYPDVAESLAVASRRPRFSPAR